MLQWLIITYWAGAKKKKKKAPAAAVNNDSIKKEGGSLKLIDRKGKLYRQYHYRVFLSSLRLTSFLICLESDGQEAHLQVPRKRRGMLM